MNKATRTLWRVALLTTTAMPVLIFEKTSVKTAVVNRTASESVNNRRHLLSTANDTGCG
jgi:hypothetical protein